MARLNSSAGGNVQPSNTPLGLATMLNERHASSSPAPNTRLGLPNFGLPLEQRLPSSQPYPADLAPADLTSRHATPSASPPPLASDQHTVAKVISFINTHKLAGMRPVTSDGRSTPGSAAGSRDWVQPSGPRKPGEGTENEEQGIISAEDGANGSVILKITLLAAGFVIGPSGASVRDIIRICGCDIKSWTEGQGNRNRRPCRAFVLSGSEAAVLHGVNVVLAAVDRYKELCEGRSNGVCVTRLQRVMGVDFCYQPPPRNIVPFAAALHGQQPALTQQRDDGRNPSALQPTLANIAAAAAASIPQLAAYTDAVYGTPSAPSPYLPPPYMGAPSAAVMPSNDSFNVYTGAAMTMGSGQLPYPYTGGGGSQGYVAPGMVTPRPGYGNGPGSPVKLQPGSPTMSMAPPPPPWAPGYMAAQDWMKVGYGNVLAPISPVPDNLGQPYSNPYMQASGQDMAFAAAFAAATAAASGATPSAYFNWYPPVFNTQPGMPNGLVPSPGNFAPASPQQQRRHGDSGGSSGGGGTYLPRQHSSGMRDGNGSNVPFSPSHRPLATPWYAPGVDDYGRRQFHGTFDSDSDDVRVAAGDNPLSKTPRRPARTPNFPTRQPRPAAAHNLHLDAEGSQGTGSVSHYGTSSGAGSSSFTRRQYVTEGGSGQVTQGSNGSIHLGHSSSAMSDYGHLQSESPVLVDATDPLVSPHRLSGQQTPRSWGGESVPGLLPHNTASAAAAIAGITQSLASLAPPSTIDANDAYAVINVEGSNNTVQSSSSYLSDKGNGEHRANVPIDLQLNTPSPRNQQQPWNASKQGELGAAPGAHAAVTTVAAAATSHPRPSSTHQRNRSF